MQGTHGSTAAPRCCQHCLDDLPVALTYELCDQTRRNQVHEPYQPWWPANIDSPTLYYRLKRRAMEHQCREQAQLGRYSDPAVWRAPRTSAAAGAPNLLLAARGQCQLSLRLPAGRTNLTTEQLESVEFVGVLSLQPAPAPPAPHHHHHHHQQYAAAASEAVLRQLEQQYVATQAAALQQQQYVAAQAAALQQQQRQAAAAAAAAQAAAHPVLRPRARRPVPLPPSSGAYAACLPQAPAPHLSLLASLQHHEQQHRQQLAAGHRLLAAEPHPAAYMSPASWQGGWQGGQPGQPLMCQPQQQQAEAARWPYAIPQQQQGGWAYASSLAPAASMAAMAAC